jgi:hypothetical protein
MPCVSKVARSARGVCVARYYDPSTGEFLSLDPAVGLTEAPFNYAGDNPVNEVDPSGLSGQETVPNPCWTEGPDRPPCCAPASQNPGGTGWLGWVAIAVTIVATLPLDETGVGEGLDAAVIATETATDVAAQTTADVAADTAEDEGLGSGEAQTLYRADTRGPDEIFRSGFSPKGSNTDLWEHVTQNPPDSGFVSTTKSLGSAQDFAGDTGIDNIYKLRGSGVDVNATFGSSSPFPWEHEVAIPGVVPGSSIEGVWGTTGWVDNPGFEP